MSRNILMKLFKELFKVLISIVELLIGGLFFYLALTGSGDLIGTIFIILTVIFTMIGFLYLWASLYGVYDVIYEIRRK